MDDDLKIAARKVTLPQSIERERSAVQFSPANFDRLSSVVLLIIRNSHFVPGNRFTRLLFDLSEQSKAYTHTVQRIKN